MEQWSSGVVEQWNVGIVEYWVIMNKIIGTKLKENETRVFGLFNSNRHH
jgi:hypothetical protein